MTNDHTDFDSCIIIYLSIRLTSDQTNYKKHEHTNDRYNSISAHDKQLLSRDWLQTVHRNLHTTLLRTFHITFIFGHFFLQQFD